MAILHLLVIYFITAWDFFATLTLLPSTIFLPTLVGLPLSKSIRFEMCIEDAISTTPPWGYFADGFENKGILFLKDKWQFWLLILQLK